MAKKSEVELDSTGLKKIWQRIGAKNWAAILTEHFPDNRWTAQSEVIKGLCPFHKESTPSFYVDSTRGLAHCFGTCGATYVNPIKFYARITRQSFAKAAQELQSNYAIKLPKEFAKNAQRIADNNDVKMQILRIARNELIDFVQNPTHTKYAYAKKLGALDDLLRRKIPLDVLHTLPIGILPNKQNLLEHLNNLDLKSLIPAVLHYLQDYLDGGTTPSSGAFLFPYFVTPNDIGRFKIRYPKPTKNVETRIYVIDDKFQGSVGLLGLNSYNHLLGEAKALGALVVEGEFDLINLLANQINNIHLGNIPIFACGGKMETDLSPIVDLDFKNLMLLPDNDNGGISWTRGLINANSHVTKVFEWPATFAAKSDPDNVVTRLGYNKAAAVFYDSSKYAYTHTWAANIVQQQLTYTEDDDIIAQYEVAQNMGTILPAEMRIPYAKKLAAATHLEQKTIIDNIGVAEDTERGFVARLKAALLGEYFLIAQDQYGHSPVIRLWSKSKNIERAVQPGSNKSLRGVLPLDLGQLEEFVANNVGTPQFLQVREGVNGQLRPLNPIEKSKLYTLYYSQALESMAADANTLDAMQTLGAGIHYKPASDNNPEAIYIVNGPHLFRGIINGTDVKYEQLAYPVIDNFTLRSARNPWSESLTSVDAINATPTYSPRKLYFKIYKMFKEGWHFKDGDLDAKFLTASVLYSPIATVFNYMVKTALNGMSHSGKTTLMQFIGGNKYPGYKLCEAAVFLDNFSSAGLQQLMSSAVLWLLLDEFEDVDNGLPNRKARAVKDFLEATRSSENGTVVVRGTPDGEARTATNWFPLTVSGINPMHAYHDINRFTHIDLEHIQEFENPIDTISKFTSTREMATIRRDITLCWLHRIPQVMAAYEEAKVEFTDNKKLPAGVFTRMKLNYLPLVAIMKIVKEDYVGFLSSAIEAKVKTLNAQGSTQEDETLISELLNAHIPRRYLDMDMGNGVITLSKIISDPAKVFLLNQADLGAYFLPNQQWLVIHWPRTIGGVLRNSIHYKGAHYPLRLKKTADAHPTAVSTTKITGDLMRTLNSLLGINAKLEELSILDMRNVIAKQSDSNNNNINGLTLVDQLQAPNVEVGDEDLPDMNNNIN